MTAERQIETHRLLQALRAEIAFFDAGGYGKPFRSQWRPTLLLRDSPTCINFCSDGQRNLCRQCPLFSFVAPEQQDTRVPCHHILLSPQGGTIADLYMRGSQKILDQQYRNWLERKIQDLTTS